MNRPEYLPEISPDDPIIEADFLEDLWKNLDVLQRSLCPHADHRLDDCCVCGFHWICKAVLALESHEIPPHIFEFLGAIRATAQDAHKSPTSRAVAALTPSASKRVQNKELEPFVLCSLVRSILGANVDEKGLKALRDNFNRSCAQIKLEGSNKLLSESSCPPHIYQLLHKDVGQHAFWTVHFGGRGLWQILERRSSDFAALARC